MRERKHAKPLRIEVMDDAMTAVLRQKSGAERLAIAFELYSSARRMLLNSLRDQHANWTEEQINDEAARRLSHGTIT